MEFQQKTRSATRSATAVQEMRAMVEDWRTYPKQVLADQRAKRASPETIADLEERCDSADVWAHLAGQALKDLEQHPRQWLAAQNFFTDFGHALKRMRPVNRGSYGKGGGGRDQARQRGEY